MYKHVIVHWYDAAEDSCHAPPEAASKLSKWGGHTTGWLYDEDDTQFKVAMEYYINDYGDELFRELRAIPRISVLYVEEFDKGKKYWEHP